MIKTKSNNNGINRNVNKANKAAAAVRSVFETLEDRQMMSVSTDAAGFTSIKPASDSRIVYVSSSHGSDSASGLSQSSAVKSVAKGFSLLRDGSADQLLLARGDVWHESLGTWTKSGRSEAEPMVIGAYGEGARPLLETGTSSGFVAGTKSHSTLSHLAITGIELYADGRDPSVHGYDKNSNAYGIFVTAKTNDLLIEDVSVHGYENNIVLIGSLGDISDVTVRRSTITDSYSVNNHSQGLFADHVQGLNIEQNTFDHNGWNTAVSGASATMFNHNIYVTATCSGLVVKGNVIARASSHGLQARPGAVVEGNLFLDNPIGLSFGLVNGAGVVAAGVSGDVKNNVFVGGGDINGSARGYGIQISNTKAGAKVAISGNIFTKDVENAFPAIILDKPVGVNATASVGINDLTIQDNIVYKWKAGLGVTSGLIPGTTGAGAVNNLVVKNNDFVKLTSAAYQNDAPLGSVRDSWTGNTTTTSTTGYANAERDVRSYDKSLGGAGSQSGFLDGARAQSKSSFKSEYSAMAVVNYIRGGFSLSPAGVVPGTTAKPVTTPTKSAPVTTPTKSTPVSKPVTTTTPVTVVAPVAAPVAPVAPVATVKSAHLNRQGHDRLTIRLGNDFFGAVTADNISVINAAGETISADNLKVSYNAKTHTATCMFPGLKHASLPKGHFSVALNGQVVLAHTAAHARKAA